jgi:hypothetical protein
VRCLSCNFAACDLIFCMACSTSVHPCIGFCVAEGGYLPAYVTIGPAKFAFCRMEVPDCP